MHPAVAASVAFLLTSLLSFGVLRLFPRLGLLDFPARYGLTRPALPYPAGVAPIIAFLLLCPVILPPSRQTLGLLVAVTVLAVTCIIDDRRGLHPLVRLAVQIAVGAVIYLAGARVFSLTNPLEPWTGFPVIPLDRLVIVSPTFANPSAVGIAFTAVWLLLTVNAMNWLDGIPGQTSVLSCIGAATIGFLALSERVAQPELATVAFSLAGLALAAACFDLPRLSVLGDTGSMFFGLLLGVLTIFAGGKLATAFLVLGMPLTDSILVIVRRVLAGKSPLRGSAKGEHLHHRLLEAGWSPTAVVGLNAVVGTTFGAAALFFTTLEKLLAALLLGLLLLLLSLLADLRRATPKTSSAR